MRHWSFVRLWWQHEPVPMRLWISLPLAWAYFLFEPTRPYLVEWHRDEGEQTVWSRTYCDSRDEAKSVIREMFAASPLVRQPAMIMDRVTLNRHWWTR